MTPGGGDGLRHGHCLSIRRRLREDGGWRRAKERGVRRVGVEGGEGAWRQGAGEAGRAAASLRGLGLCWGPWCAADWAAPAPEDGTPQPGPTNPAAALSMRPSSASPDRPFYRGRDDIAGLREPRLCQGKWPTLRSSQRLFPVCRVPTFSLE